MICGDIGRGLINNHKSGHGGSFQSWIWHVPLAILTRTRHLIYYSRLILPYSGFVIFWAICSGWRILVLTSMIYDRKRRFPDPFFYMMVFVSEVSWVRCGVWKGMNRNRHYAVKPVARNRHPIHTRDEKKLRNNSISTCKWWKVVML